MEDIVTASNAASGFFILTNQNILIEYMTLEKESRGTPVASNCRYWYICGFASTPNTMKVNGINTSHEREQN